ncbi:helix-turn-helix domain-containing protein [Allorhizocola rhizosphaerae]|uniref:helix-turn-helix domain-containing protein n=1 Tax=Allorhizocola rhizosphaerae TaxID=1872709 RepID=UPI000E3C23C2|nr:helix-turn-helix transcriptional regulator [Allorhizocola rhizosphaerae]
MATQQMPVMRRRRIGLTLRKMREQNNMTLEQVAELMECSQSKISRIETGHSSVGMRDVRDLLEIYGVTGQDAMDIMDMAREARRHERQRSWWHPYSNVLVSAYVGNENAASRVRAYEHQVVPGLLQTKDYAEAMFRTSNPNARPEEISERVRVRLGRQSLLTREDENPLQFEVVLDEAVISRPVGGDEVMKAQMLRLCESASSMSNVTIQLLPFEAGAHPAMEGTFAILDFAESDGSSLVYAENATGGLFLEKERELRFYENIFDRLREAALSPEESVKRIAFLAEEPRWKRV